MSLLTKSKFSTGLKCLRALWLEVNTPEALVPPSSADLFRMKQGTAIGEFAKAYFPGGLDARSKAGKVAKHQSQQSLTEPKVLFEAGYDYGECYARSDVLRPAGNAWDLIEVKSSSGVKEKYLYDVAFQRYVYEGAGLKINKCFLQHINGKFIKQGTIDPQAYFTLTDITKEVEELLPGIPEQVKLMLDTMTGPKPERCPSPNTCMADCWNFLPSNSVFDLTRAGKRCEELFEKNVVSMIDIPADYSLTEKQKIQVETAKTKKPHIDEAEIKRFLGTLRHPLYYLDFESCNPPMPLYDGTKPFQQIPFQYSLHIMKESEEQHHEFLADSPAQDPRPAFLKALKKDIGTTGTILVYSKSFETGRLKECLEAFPEHDWIPAVINRIIDLWVPFRTFQYYDPKQEGSTSIKAVLPALTGMGYSDLTINDGLTAGLEWQRAATLQPIQQEKIHEDLLKYCKRDTKSMVEVLKVIEK